MGRIIKNIECPVQSFEKGTLIFKEGSPADYFYWIRSGKVEIIKNHGTPQAKSLALLGEKRVFGEVSAFDNQPRSATAIAKESTEVTLVSTNAIQGQLEQCPGWFQAVLLDLVSRLRNASDMAAVAVSPNTEEST